MEKEQLLKMMNGSEKESLMRTLEIDFVDVGDDFLVARMPVTPKLHQPDGVLHGGATFALAESVGSAAAYLFNKTKNPMVRGIEMSGNHLKGISEGFVYAKAKAIHNGRTTQIWEIKVTNEAEDLISSCKLTTLTLPKK
ncbi:MAG: PaaI family thioesterase [Flavobacteriaceae bacterium]|jgi:1,4-dihydroxy-2-naphthoyl-CoA hydrolase|nr:PaaI family thioesterase [Candidatus Arcticimaribacter sp.]MDG1058192.1 PaaI family thioesterase [Flavobacteriaceae bacterium]MDG1091852.1 PaaI family thioesterase [Flavobacteriaceae bacterium]